MNNIYQLDPHMIDLARRALKCKHWTIHPPEASRQLPKRNQRGMLWVRESQSWGDWLPDFTDDATLGCLNGLVRKAWDDFAACVVPIDYGPGGVMWVCRLSAGGRSLTDKHWATEVEALVAALETAE